MQLSTRPATVFSISCEISRIATTGFDRPKRLTIPQALRRIRPAGFDSGYASGLYDGVGAMRRGGGSLKGRLMRPVRYTMAHGTRCRIPSGVIALCPFGAREFIPSYPFSRESIYYEAP